MQAQDEHPSRPARATARRHQQLSESVAEQIREAIIVGEYREGFLRTDWLAETLGVSQTPVREALMILQAEGTVRWEPRRGFRLLPFTTMDIEDLYNVQAYIAGELAARAAQTMLAADIDRLDELQVELEAAQAAHEAHGVDRINHDIHKAINTASGSTKLTHLLSQTVRYVPLGYFAQIEGWSDASAHDHGAILAALRLGDAENSRTAMVDHIHHIGRLLLNHLVTQDVVQPDSTVSQPESGGTAGKPRPAKKKHPRGHTAQPTDAA